MTSHIFAVHLFQDKVLLIAGITGGWNALAIPAVLAATGTTVTMDFGITAGF